MAVDHINEFIYIGAKNYLIKLSFKNDSLKLLNPATDLLAWEPNIDTINDCRSAHSHNSAKYCQNYIRLVLLDKNNIDRLLICGTYARRPTCTYRSKEHLSLTLDTFDGIGKCPNSPDSSLAYLSLKNGDHYFATSIDYSEQGLRPDYLINRNLGPSSQLRTDQFNSNWLNDPVFVASIEVGDHVYFFVRETAIEHMNCGERIYSRVVRLCKHDQGSANYNVWKSFEKARLSCFIPGSDGNETTGHKKYPFHFDEIQNVHFDESQKLVYALFTTPE
jgi:hypothetical protein